MRRPLVGNLDTDRRADAVTVVLGNVALPGIGYLLLHRYVAAAVAIFVTAAIGLLMFNSPGNGFGPVLLVTWWSVIAIHTMVAVRGLWVWRPAKGHRASMWLSRSGGVGLVLIVFVMIASVRSHAASILDEATDAHRRGDCESTQSILERLDEAHAVVAGQAVADAAAQSEACEVLIAALGREETLEIVGGLDDYIAEPGAVWEEAWVERAELLLDLAMRLPPDREDYSAWAFDYLAQTLAEVPSQSEQVRAVVTDFLTEFDALGVDCLSTDLFVLLSDRGDREPELAEPIAAFGELAPERLLACAREQTGEPDFTDPFYDNDLEDAIARYEQFLDAYPDHELAAQAEQELADVEAQLTAYRAEEESQRIRERVESGIYCGQGGVYLDAEPYDGDAGDSVFVEGPNGVKEALPSRLAADNVDEVSLVMCVSAGSGQGVVVDTCEYEVIGYPGGTESVDLYGREYSVEVYELATGEVIESYTEQVGGDCPSSVECTSYNYTVVTCPESVAAHVGRDDLADIFDRW
jgi:hypothetical protein